MSPRVVPHIQKIHDINMYWNESCHTYVLECVTSYICFEMSHGTESRDTCVEMSHVTMDYATNERSHVAHVCSSESWHTCVLEWGISGEVVAHMCWNESCHTCVGMSHVIHICCNESCRGKPSHICVATSHA